MWWPPSIQAWIAEHTADAVNVRQAGYPIRTIIVWRAHPPLTAPRAMLPTISVGPHGAMVEHGGVGDGPKQYARALMD